MSKDLNALLSINQAIIEL